MGRKVLVVTSEEITPVIFTLQRVPQPEVVIAKFYLSMTVDCLDWE